MDTENLRIIFMGTPEFAVPSLQILVENGWNVVGVITAPDKPKGRGQKMAISPVKAFAEERGLNILQPTNLKDEEFQEGLKALKADLQIVVAFRMLPEAVWSMPSHGTFNLHASLLPQYRGAAPINWAVINGETETGVTTFFLAHEIDTGNIIMQETEEITSSDTAGSLYERLMIKGADLVLKTVEAISNGSVNPSKQLVSEELKPAPKIFREDCEIDWSQTASEVYNFIRGMAPYPGAFTKLPDGRTIKIFESELSIANYEEDVMATDGKSYIAFKASDGWIRVNELQVQGKKKMKTEDFLRGNQLT